QNQPPVRFIRLLVIAAIAAVLLAAAGFAFGASQETHDSFCASCHTQPESTYVGRSTAAAPVDMASFHTGQATRCIDCHSGQGLTGRIQAELLGAKNALKWYSGTAIQPAPLTVPITDENCLKCHQAVTQQGYTPQQQITVPGASSGEGEREGRANHWHQFLSRWQAASPAAGTCTSCHSGHLTDGTAQTGFMNPQTVQDTCNACHQVLRREGGG
ncbi:MAG TPA: NapC/NirT family cytochrome c, partial [Anaerolineaceae bacterium]|nr:NapC/NirT family cytochrome c [Anaerolineaceae bacterium]